MNTLQRTRPATLGCVGCPAETMDACNACPCRQTAGGQLGFTLPAIDFTNWQTWAIGALAALVLYQLFFSSEKRQKRADRSARLSAARRRYQDQVRRIKEAA